MKRGRDRNSAVLMGLLMTSLLMACSGGPRQTGVTDGNRLPPTQNPEPPESLDAELQPHMATAARCDVINPEYCLFPWPNDHFTAPDPSKDTGLRLNLAPDSMPRNVEGLAIDPTEWNRNDGFSTGQMILARVPGLDWEQTGAVPITDIGASFAPDQPVLLIDAQTGERQLIWAELDANGTRQSHAAPDADPGPALIIRPARNLEHGRRYIVALRYLRDAGGEILQPPPGFRVYRDDVPSALEPVNARRDDFDALFADLERAGVSRVGLYLAWDFTTISARDVSERAVHIRDEALAGLGAAAPGFRIDDDIVNPVFEGNPDIAAITARRIRGHFTVPCFLDTPNCQTGGRFRYEPGPDGDYGDGLPDVAGTADVPFICSIARSTYNGADDPTQAAAFTPARISLYGHGLLGSRDEGNTYGFNVREMAQEHNIVFCMTDWAGMAQGTLTRLTPDDAINDPFKYDPAWDAGSGDLPTVGLILNDISFFPRLADRLQQGFVNMMLLGKLMLHPDGLCSAPAFQVQGECVLDRSELFFDGNSMGAIMGGALTALSPDIRAAVLGVNGMNFSTLLRRSVDFDQFAVAMYASYPASLDQSFIISFMQNLWDRGETNGYVNFLRPGRGLPGTPAKRVLTHPAFADHQVTSYAAEVQARSMEAAMHCPAMVGGPRAQRGDKILGTPHPFVGQHELDFDRRHPDDEPFFGIPCVSYPHTGNAMVMWDSGPRFDDAGNERPDGAAPPPINNTPPRPADGYGTDPHGHPRSEVTGRLQKSEWLKADGALIDVCQGEPCTAKGFDPTP